MASLFICVEQFKSITSEFGIRPCVAKEIWQRMEDMNNYKNPNWFDDLLTAMIEQGGEGHPHGL